MRNRIFAAAFVCVAGCAVSLSAHHSHANYDISKWTLMEGTVKQVIMPAALPGVVAALLLAISRAIGETMIVVMAAGQRAQITATRPSITTPGTRRRST